MENTTVKNILKAINGKIITGKPIPNNILLYQILNNLIEVYTNKNTEHECYSILDQLIDLKKELEYECSDICTIK